MLLLHSYWLSSCAHRVRIALHHKHLPFEYVAVDIVGGSEDGEVHPLRQVPTLFHDGVPITQSLAIVEYLEDAFPEAPSLLPSTALERAAARAIACHVESGIQPHQNLSTRGLIEGLTAQAGGDGKHVGKEYARQQVHKGLTALESLVGRTSGQFCVGDSVTVADVFLLPQLAAAPRFRLPTSSYPTLAGIVSRLETLPAFVRAEPKNQPDAEQRPPPPTTA